MAWFFTAIFLFPGQPPVHDRVGPFPDEQACMVKRIEMQGDMPGMTPTPCTKMKVSRPPKH